MLFSETKQQLEANETKPTSIASSIFFDLVKAGTGMHGCTILTQTAALGIDDSGSDP